MSPLNLAWHEPTTVEEATALLADLGEAAKVLAGGTWLTIVLKQGLLAPEALVSLHRIPGLDRIEVDADGTLRVGARVTHRQMECSDVVRAGWPMLAETYRVVANVRVRHQATVGGNLCDADYASDPPTTLTALDAEVVAISARGERRIPVADLIVGHYETVLAPAELVTEVRVPPLPAGASGVYIKYRSRSHEDRPCVGVAALVVTDGEGVCRDLRVTVGAVASTPQRLREAEAIARGRVLDEGVAREVARAYAAAIDPLADIRGSAWYRTRMIEVWVRRAILAANGVRGQGADGRGQERL